jgi:hypothetical protein
MATESFLKAVFTRRSRAADYFDAKTQGREG